MGPSNPVVVGDLQFDRIAGTVTREGYPLIDGGLTLELFTALVDAAPEALDADHLAQRVWHRDHVSVDTISKRVSLLREGLGSDHYVQTLPGRRYRLAVPLGDPPRHERNTQSKRAPKAKLAPVLIITLAALIALAVAFSTDQKTADSTEAAPIGVPRMEAPTDDQPARLIAPDGTVLEAPAEDGQ